MGLISGFYWSPDLWYYFASGYAHLPEMFLKIARLGLVQADLSSYRKFTSAVNRTA